MQIARTLADLPAPGRRCDGSFESENKLLGLIAGGLIATMALAQPLGAEELVLHGKYYSSETYLEVMSYVQQLGDEQVSTGSPHESPHNFTPIDDETYSALRNFVKNIGAEQVEPASASGPAYHSSTADPAYLALRDFVREIGGEQSVPDEGKQLLLAAAEQPKAASPAKAKAAAKPAKAVNPDDATYVGSQVCTGCHANQSTRFGNTVMGKIFLKNPRNAQE